MRLSQHPATGSRSPSHLLIFSSHTMQLTIVSTFVALLFSATASLAVPVEGYQGHTVGVPLPPKVPVQVFNATVGYNATHTHLGARSDLAARQVYTGDATYFYPGLGAPVNLFDSKRYVLMCVLVDVDAVVRTLSTSTSSHSTPRWVHTVSLSLGAAANNLRSSGTTEPTAGAA